MNSLHVRSALRLSFSIGIAKMQSIHRNRLITSWLAVAAMALLNEVPSHNNWRPAANHNSLSPRTGRQLRLCCHLALVLASAAATSETRP